MFNKRLWLNSEDSSSTGSVVGYYGPAWWKEADPDKPTAFFEVADCHVKARLHLTDRDTPSDFIAKLRRVASVATELADYIAYHSCDSEPGSNQATVKDEPSQESSATQFDIIAMLELAEKAQKHARMEFNPFTGKPLTDDSSPVRRYVESWRHLYGSVKWEFDPWAGEARSEPLMKADPTGLFIIPDVK
jgi:hypothetical protein